MGQSIKKKENLRWFNVNVRGYDSMVELKAALEAPDFLSSVNSLVVLVQEDLFDDSKKLDVEQNLIENEIGGVILGSLGAALMKEPLTLEQYLSENRSNVPNETEEGLTLRRAIYTEFDRYRKWKIEEAKYDLHDVVLELIRSGVEEELFGSGKYR